ncbi:MAG: DUF3422 domain-containing protein [Rubrivivax sp.]|nr:DUF3422 domain-containing protein [Rubrivivax sp.]
MTTLPPDHPQRQLLADEVHARPFEPVSVPAVAGYLAALVPEEARAAELAHLGRLAQQYGAPPPGPAETLWRVDLAGLRLKWERHGEFSGYLFLQPQADEAERGAAAAAWDTLPSGWLERIPGQTIVAVRVDIRAASAAGPGAGAGRAADPEEIAAHFAGQTVVGSMIASGAGYAYTDFRLRPEGFVRMLLLDAGLNPRQAGRMLQRLLEIEAYRMLAMLALPIARRQSPRIAAIENALAQLTDGIARDDGRGEELLHELTRLAAEVESGLAASRFRFGACRAYSELVGRRIEELRESRIEGLQTIAEFMSRRFSPAVATCMNVEQRLHDLSERVSQASSLLATRVGIAREKQNQQLLASMERRARLQLRLQQTVEGLSVAAILYYVIGLVAYVAKGLEAGGAPVNASLVVLGAVPVAGAAVLWALHRARRKLRNADL